MVLVLNVVYVLTSRATMTHLQMLKVMQTTQTAVEGYIDQRLGFDRDGIGGPVIGPCYEFGGLFSPTPTNMI